MQLVKLEGEIRDLPSAMAVAFHAVNEARSLAGFSQGFFLRMNRRQNLVMEAVSAVASIDVHAPFILAISRLANDAPQTGKALALSLAGLQGGTYPAPHGLWLPLSDRKGKVFAGLLFARDTPWGEAETQIAVRLAGSYRQAFLALTPPALLRVPSLPRWAFAAAALLLAALALIPVPLTALAPFEVVADEPVIVAAAVDGAIASIAAPPNQMVGAGQELFRLDDTVQKADVAVASQKVDVAESRFQAARNGAFADGEAKRSLATAEKELALAQSERDYAASLLARMVVTAPEAGLLIYSAKSDLMGRPVRVGEKVMEIADPTRVAFKIDLGVKDAIALSPDAGVKLFLDSDPLHPLSATIAQTSYHAREIAGGALAYEVRARSTATPPRIGLRGTAQVTGVRVPLGFYLLRRPIAALRQYFGR